MADLEHITAEGETYDISDATARTDISALQTENENLKAQIAEMEEEISELNSDLTPVDRTSEVTLGSTVTNNPTNILFTFDNIGILSALIQVSAGTYGLHDAILTLPVKPVEMKHFGVNTVSGNVYDMRIETSGIVDFNSSNTFSSSTYLVLNLVFIIGS